MLYVIDKSNRTAFADQVEQMFRIRHDIYVKQRDWTALDRPDGREIDQFDTEAAVYLLGIDATGGVYSGVRLSPTMGPHLIGDMFSHVVTLGDVPRSDAIFEMTRYFVAGHGLTREERRRKGGEVLCAMFEYGLARGLTQFSLLCDTFFMPSMLELKWKVRPLGVPTPYREGSCIAVLFDITHDALERTRAVRDVKGPVLSFSPTPPLRRAVS